MGSDSPTGAEAPGPVSLREAAQLLAVHYMTAYRYVRVGRLDATYCGGRWWVEREVLDRFAAELAKVVAQPTRRRRASGVWQRLERRLVAGDEAGAWAIVETALVGGMPPKLVVLSVLAPALRSVGDGWESGRLSVMDEHRASAVAGRLIGRLGPRFSRPGRTSGTVVLAGAPGDPHSLPAAMVRDVLRGDGYQVIDLGANTPTASVVEAIAGADRDGVMLAAGLSVSADGHATAVRRTIRAIRAAAPDVPVFVGGPAVPSRTVARDLGGDDWAVDAGDFADRLAHLRTQARARVTMPSGGDRPASETDG
jgi:excisionase family DNA binding protein